MSAPIDRIPTARIDNDDLHFDVRHRFPQPWEIFPHGGVPGFHYLYASAHRVAHFQQPDGGGWRRAEGIPDLLFTGPKGTCPVVVMCKGERMPGAAQGVHRPPWYVDEEIEEKTGQTNGVVRPRKATQEDIDRAREDKAPAGRPPKQPAKAEEARTGTGG